MSNKMDMQQFTNYVRENIVSFLPEDYKDASVRQEQIQKNNGISLDAIMICKSDINIFPTIYMKEYFSDYEAGRDLDEIMREIANTQQKYDLGESIDISMLTDFEKVKDKIVPRLINAEKNKELLKTRPHLLIEDLAVVYQIELGRSDNDAIMSTAVHNAMFEGFRISVEELHNIALENIGKVMHPKIMSIREMLGAMLPDGMDEDMLPPEDPVGMYILTCDSKSYGAVVALDQKIMDEIVDKFGSFFILPSSVHELIILPDDGETSISELEGLVDEVNGSQVAETEVLSNRVYRYDKANKTIRLASAA